MPMILGLLRFHRVHLGTPQLEFLLYLGGQGVVTRGQILPKDGHEEIASEYYSPINMKSPMTGVALKLFQWLVASSKWVLAPVPSWYLGITSELMVHQMLAQWRPCHYCKLRLQAVVVPSRGSRCCFWYVQCNAVPHKLQLEFRS